MSINLQTEIEKQTRRNLVDRALDALKAARDLPTHEERMAAIRAADEAYYAEKLLLDSYYGVRA